MGNGGGQYIPRCQAADVLFIARLLRQAAGEISHHLTVALAQPQNLEAHGLPDPRDNGDILGRLPTGDIDRLVALYDACDVAERNVQTQFVVAHGAERLADATVAQGFLQPLHGRDSFGVAGSEIQGSFRLITMVHGLIPFLMLYDPYAFALPDGSPGWFDGLSYASGWGKYVTPSKKFLRCRVRKQEQTA